MSEISSDHCIERSNSRVTLQFDKQRGIDALNDHMIKLIPLLGTKKHVKLFSSNFRFALLRNVFIKLLSPVWNSLNQLDIEINTKVFNHCIGVLRLFPDCRIKNCQISVNSNVIFRTLSQDLLCTLPSVPFLEQLKFPQIENMTIEISSVESNFEDPLSFQNFHWFKILLERLHTHYLHFYFIDVIEEEMEQITYMLDSELGLAWHLSPTSKQDSTTFVSFVKDTKEYIRTKEYVYIKATPFWVQHDRKKSHIYIER